MSFKLIKTGAYPIEELGSNCVMATSTIVQKVVWRDREYIERVLDGEFVDKKPSIVVRQVGCDTFKSAAMRGPDFIVEDSESPYFGRHMFSGILETEGLLKDIWDKCFPQPDSIIAVHPPAPDYICLNELKGKKYVHIEFSTKSDLEEMKSILDKNSIVYYRCSLGYNALKIKVEEFVHKFVDPLLDSLYEDEEKKNKAEVEKLAIKTYLKG